MKFIGNRQFISIKVEKKKSNLELFKEELKARQEERSERHRIKSVIRCGHKKRQSHLYLRVPNHIYFPRCRIKSSHVVFDVFSSKTPMWCPLNVFHKIRDYLFSGLLKTYNETKFLSGAASLNSDFCRFF